MSANRKKWNTDHVPEGYPKECNTDLLKTVIQDLNDEYITKKKNGKINKIWEDIILQLIKSGDEELQQRKQVKAKPSRFSMDNPIVWLLMSIILVILVAAIWFWADRIGAQLRFGSN